MKTMKRMVALSLATAMMAGALSGCGSKPAESTSQDSSDADKLVIALQTDSMVSDYNNNYFTQYLENKLGIDLEFYQLPTQGSEVATKVSLMATSKEGLPDVLIVNNALTPETILEYGSSGVFLPLNEYVEDAAKMPNYNAIPEADRAIMDDSQTMADGNMYSLSKYEPETWNLTPNRMFINKTWLDNLGLEVPKTTDELKNVLIKFRDEDPNGNGRKDEIGVYGFQAGGYGQDITAALMNSFVFWNGGVYGGLSLADDGKTVIAPFTTEGWKQGLKFMNDLYNEGLLSPETFTNDSTQFQATLNQEDNVVGLTSFGSLSNYPKDAPNYLEMEMIEPFAGPEGIRYTPYSNYVPSQEFFIFSGCEKVDLAIKLADEFYNPETSIISRFGEEGIDWTNDPEQMKDMTNAYVEAGLYDSINMAYISNQWLEPSAKTWHGISPRYASLDDMNRVANGTAPYDPTNLNAKNYELYVDKHPDAVLPLLHYTKDEADTIQEALTNIPDFVKQTLAEFVTGARNVDTDWDSYISELNTMGLENWLSCAQAAFDRTQG